MGPGGVTSQKRLLARQRKRLQLELSGPAGAGMGFTENVSATGLLVHSNLVFPPGSRVRVTLRLPDGGTTSFDTEVRWSRRVEGALALTAKNSMGLRLLAPPDEGFYQLLAPDKVTAR